MLEFLCADPNIIKNMPIISINELKYEWFEKAKNHYRNNPSKFETTKCPGIVSLMNRGWIQRAYQDIVIETGKNPNVFIGYGKKEQTKIPGGKYIGEYVSQHSSKQMQEFKDSWPKNTLHCIIKIQSPWFVKIPKGYSLLLMPVPYAEDVRFTAATGIIKGTEYLNIQLFWHCMNSKEVIKAGTPLNHMILLKDEKIDMKQYVIEDIDSFIKTEFPETYSLANK